MEKPYKSVHNRDIVHERGFTNARLHRKDIYSAISGNEISGSHALAKGSYKERTLQFLNMFPYVPVEGNVPSKAWLELELNFVRNSDTACKNICVVFSSIRCKKILKQHENWLCGVVVRVSG
jgi:hypothetical protein